MRIMNAVLVLQSVTLAWISVKKKESIKELMGRSELRSSSCTHFFSESISYILVSLQFSLPDL